jgi:hypothetical protein
MNTPSSSIHSARPNCSRRRKRLSDILSPGTIQSPKRAKLDPKLQDYDEIHQYVLLAAAKVLCVPVRKLLSLVDSSKSLATSSRSNSLDVVSKTSSEDLAGGKTPPEAPDYEEVLGSCDIPFAERSQPSSTAVTVQNPLPTQSAGLEIYANALSIEQLAKDLDGGTNIDLFAPTEFRQTPIMYQADHGVSRIGNFQLADDPWQTCPTLDIPLPAQRAHGNTNDHITGLSLPESRNELGNLTSACPGQVLWNEMTQGLQSLDGQNYMNSDWDMLNTWPGGSSMVPFDPNLNLLEVPYRDVIGDENTKGDGNTKRDGNVKGRRRGPFRVEEQRQETGLTRKIGACIRCSMLRIRVSIHKDLYLMSIADLFPVFTGPEQYARLLSNLHSDFFKVTQTTMSSIQDYGFRAFRS